MMTDDSSQRAKEVARDLMAELSEELAARALAGRALQFRLDGSEEILSGSSAEAWIRESVDAGFPEVRYVIERVEETMILVNLAAFEDPDSQYFEPASDGS
jgi:hypothetical protein